MSESDPEKNLRLISTAAKVKIDSQCAPKKVETANAEVSCNRENLDELLEAENDKIDRNGNIVLKKYLELTTDAETRNNFLLRILTKAINKHKCYAIHGTFPALRKPLANRGWIEKRAIRRMILTSDTYAGCI